MKKGHKLLGLVVMDLELGEEIGEVVDIVFDSQRREIKGLIIENNKSKNNFISYQNIYGLGEDIITIANQGAIEKIDNQAESLVNKENIIGTKVITNGGEELGVVDDIVLDEEGRLTGYELSDGLVQDILEGRQVLGLDREITYGKDAIIVDKID